MKGAHFHIIRMQTPEQFDGSRVRLWDEIVRVRSTWIEYELLFDHSAERVRLLNACAGAFFGLAQRLMLRETILGISRLTDPREAGRHSNLVLETLLDDPAFEQNSGDRDAVADAVQKAVDAAVDVRIHRNKYVAHLDKATALHSAVEPLPGIRRDAIGGMITKIESAYNTHGFRVRGSGAFFDSSPLLGAEALIAILEKSERWRRVCELELKSGPDIC